MVQAKGYKEVSFKDFQYRLHIAKSDCPKTYPEIAVSMGLKDIQTVKSCFDTKRQKVKDSVLSKLMACIGVHGFILWVNGERKYYISNK
jgi:hypothetical protein